MADDGWPAVAPGKKTCPGNGTVTGTCAGNGTGMLYACGETTLAFAFAFASCILLFVACTPCGGDALL